MTSGYYGIDMDIIFYNNKSDSRQLVKELIQGITLSGTLRKESSIIKPNITIESSEIIRYNYAYIPLFRRYYFINNIDVMRGNIWNLDLEVDPLMSFKKDILSYNVIVDKQELITNGDEYIDDGSLVTDNKMFSRIYNFANGFNSRGELILITAG